MKMIIEDMKTRMLWAFALILVLTVACGDQKKEKAKDSAAAEMEETLSVREMDVPMEASKNLSETILANADYATLAKALKSAELLRPLETMDSITLFAPTNDAFSQLPEGLTSDLMSPAGAATLKNILKYHIVGGNHDRASLLSKLEQNDSLELNTLHGKALWISLENNEIVLRDKTDKTATVISFDMDVENGVMHSIDAVLMPDY